jgi:hypothetical protein
VALRARTGTAFRWRPTHLPGEAADVVRVFDDGVFTLALLANGYECGFSTCWPPASRSMLDLFVDAWRSTSGSARERLLDAFALARDRFVDRAPALVAPDADFPDDLPCAVLMAVVLEGAAAHVAWVGGDVAIVARNADVVFETTPHSLVERVRRAHPDVTDLSAVPNVLDRVIGGKPPDTEPPDCVTAMLAADDTLVLLSRAALRGPCVPARDAAVMAATTKEPWALAARLADAAFGNTDAAYAAVAVLRMEAPSYP